MKDKLKIKTMETKRFIQQFPGITEQEKVSDEILDSLIAGECREGCPNGCQNKNMKNDNKVKQPA